MNRQFSKPIRTYERKKCKDVATFSNLHIQPVNDIGSKNRVSHKKKIHGEKEATDDSMYYDPFDTTFDRLARNARSLPPVTKTNDDEVSYNSIDNSSSWNINKSENEPIEVDDVSDNKAIRVHKVVYKKPKMQSTKKTLKKKLIESQNNNNFKVKKDGINKKHKVYKTRKNNKSISTDVNIDLPNLHSENDSEIKNYNKIQRKNYNKNYSLQKNKKNNRKLKKQSKNNVQTKSCSVILNKCSIPRWESKVNLVENNLSVDIHENTLEKQQSSDHNSNKMNIKTVECNNINIRYCSVNVKRLDVDSSIKSFNFRKKYENIFSSTPNHRSVKSSTDLISLSPIPTVYSKKLTNSITCRDNILTSTDSKDLVSHESNQANSYLHRKSDGLEKCMSERKSDLLSTSLKNVSNLSKCNLKPLENSLTMFSYISNNICNHKEYPTEEICEKSLNLVQNISINEIKKNCTSSNSEQACVVVDKGRKKYQLNFSVDANKSHSLFDDTNENIENKSHSDIIINNSIKMSINNITLDKTNTISYNEMCYNSIQSCEKQISGTTNINMRVICDKIEEEPSKLLYSSKETILDASSDNIQLKSRTIKVDDSDSNKENITEQTDSLSKKYNTSNVNNCFINNDKKYSICDSYVILKRLQDSIRVTKRRNQSYKWNLDINSSPKDSNNGTEQICSERKEESEKLILPRKRLLLENIMEESVNTTSVEIYKPIYLKPGKSWARSLTILNNIQNKSNLDKLSIGKGKKWRYSVQNVLKMQKQGIIQSCIKRNSSEKELEVCNEEIDESECKLADNKTRTCDSTSLGRLSRRISVRVVPIHKTIKSIEDAPFLEVYGIVPVKSQRYTLINNSKKSSVCSIQNDDLNDQNIKEHVTSTAKEVILQRCLQEDYIPLSTYFSDLYLEHCRKIGEGVYGEVFLYEHEDKRSVVKVIPIEGTEYINGEPQKKFHEILSEIVIAMELHNLRFNTTYNTDGFVEVKNVKCIKGKYPEKLIALWNIYDEEKHSDNDCPSIFNDDQLYIVLELGHGGQDLEAFVFNTAEEAHILFIQAALALAVAEKAIQFEHRDLHWGNILISPTNDFYVHYKLGRRKIKLISKGVKVSIIDFTLSRVTYQGCSVFNDLALDPTLFTAQGEYQFEVYRLMRDKVKNDWQKFEPYTNVLWLHYTLDKMITAVRYRKRNLKIHKNSITKLKDLKDEILTYNSAFDFVTNCDKIVNLMYNDS